MSEHHQSDNINQTMAVRLVAKYNKDPYLWAKIETRLFFTSLVSIAHAMTEQIYQV
jgi:hypothetical protein